jgi:hypothetical protein
MIRAFIASFGFLAAATFVCQVRAQQPSQVQASTASSSDGSTAAKPKPKKVWTNDDMADVTGTISVVGTPTPQRSARPQGASSISSFQQPEATKPGQNKAPDVKKPGDNSVDPKTLAQLRQQLQKLQTSIDQLDKQIDQLKGASQGDTKNLGILKSDPSQYSMEPVPDQIKALEAKKSGLQAAMDQLLDAARASGIEPGQLR